MWFYCVDMYIVWILCVDKSIYVLYIVCRYMSCCPVQVLDQYKSVGAELNVMPYCSQFIPLEVVNHPQHK